MLGSAVARSTQTFGVYEMMKLRHHRLPIRITGLVIAFCLSVSQSNAQDAFVRYKQKMLPTVGKTISVTGVIQFGKLGWFLSAGGWGIYIIPVNDSDLDKANALNAFIGRRVRATGTLLHRFASHSKRVGDAGMPEHFFFDAGEVKVVLLPPRHKRVSKH